MVSVGPFNVRRQKTMGGAQKYMKVTFYRTATNSKGEPYQVALLTIALPSHLSKEEALVAATSQFETEMKVEHWQKVAHTREFT